jgi:hypothetical protein
MRAGDDRIDPKAHFDPALLAAFVRHQENFEAVFAELSDEV